MTYDILRGDCLAAMRLMPDNSMDSIVTDPPYELGFMGKSWDASGIAYNVEMWREALRVLKPGGHLLAFSGSRTYHRMTCSIEDAGFEIRDQIMWVYGSGFPKSMDVSKAIDKAAGAVREVVGKRTDGRYAYEFNGTANRPTGAAAGTEDAERIGGFVSEKGIITAPATDAARQWEGWGTALKPAHEPICVARKPLVGTVAANVLQFGTGALNIDACRIETSDNLNGGAYATTRQESTSEWAASGSLHKTTGQTFKQPAGRWPANLIHDGSAEVVALFPSQAGARAPVRGTEPSSSTKSVFGQINRQASNAFHADTGSAARFFYCAKASKSDRGPGNTHPTVKPLALLRYLLRLVTPPGGRVLDPFLGSGSTVVAGLQEGFHVTGIELLDEHADIAEARAVRELVGDLL